MISANFMKSKEKRYGFCQKYMQSDWLIALGVDAISTYHA